jgi:hypothetical protein
VGDFWEVTFTTDVEGAPSTSAPGRVEVCTPAVWTRPLDVTDARLKCRSTDFKVVEDRATWNVTCVGPPVQVGQAEVTRRGTDAYTGSMILFSEEGTTTIRIDGRRTRPCDEPR